MDFNNLNELSSDDSLWDEKYDFELSNLITEARIHAGLTQEQLAKRLGTKQPSVARAENGDLKPSHEFLKRVAKAVGTELIAPKFAFMDQSVGQFTFNSERNHTERGTEKDEIVYDSLKTYSEVNKDSSHGK